MNKKYLQLVVLAALVAVGAVLYTQQQALIDWWKLRGYAAPAAVAQLATDATMTDQARHLLYVNHPQITGGSTFTSQCPVGGEKTVVLGCYLTNDHGIFIYDVTDIRLDGVEQVTAAHEMLHAAYDRLSKKERSDVDALLMDYYQTGLTDQRIKDTIEAYKKSEPNDVVNEMHSIFGTEVAELPQALEDYYTQYFTDRHVVTDRTAKYQNEFTSRQKQVADYDAQLAALKTQIDDDERQLTAQKAALEAQSAQLNAQRTAGNIDQYNAAVASYNRAVNTYNTLLAAAKKRIAQYNTIVDQRNAVVLEEQQLTRAISANSLQ